MRVQIHKAQLDVLCEVVIEAKLIDFGHVRVVIPKGGPYAGTHAT
jgi:hypothetical protein